LSVCRILVHQSISWVMFGAVRHSNPEIGAEAEESPRSKSKVDNVYPVYHNTDYGYQDPNS